MSVVAWWCSGKDTGLANFVSMVRIPVMTLPGYFCDRWLSVNYRTYDLALQALSSTTTGNCGLPPTFNIPCTNFAIHMLSIYLLTLTNSGHVIRMDFYSAATLLAMQRQSTVIPTAIPSVLCLSVRESHAGTLSRRMKEWSCGLHCEVAKTL